ncbi:unnamed protein product [Vitrella brassicaformis CCMP3155]|uniref:Uncharacterized protein n=1 Tax=Vitrella brassicaformis (strain CCMP3155) TaxID=1169540 RepID=A0A0G4FHC4_VITBC|nr:unnamed protein product [Vitrella brassicaformis CCMP3155]|eukprot:CEM12909.1 unnamed protein product [Vitrella brassicaformis CCMP3155]
MTCFIEEPEPTPEDERKAFLRELEERDRRSDNFFTRGLRNLERQAGLFMQANPEFARQAFLLDAMQREM